MVKNLPAMKETQVQSLGWEVSLEKGTHPGEGNGHRLQYSCLDNSMDKGTWQATVHGGHTDLDMTEWCIFYDAVGVGNISGSLVFSKSSLYIWKFLVHVLLKQVVLVQPLLVSLILSSEIWWMQGFACSLQNWRLCLPQFCGSLIIKSRWPSRSDSLGKSNPFVGFQTEKPEVRFRIFTTVEVLIWYYCSPVFQSLTKWIWNFILSWLCPSYCFTAASSLSLGMEYLFSVGSSVLLLMVVQQLVLILMLFQEEMNTCLSVLPSWIRS